MKRRRPGWKKLRRLLTEKDYRIWKNKKISEKRQSGSSIQGLPGCLKVKDPDAGIRGIKLAAMQACPLGLLLAGIKIMYKNRTLQVLFFCPKLLKIENHFSQIHALTVAESGLYNVVSSDTNCWGHELIQ